ncbi:outer membrane lipoprotein chaperone LolA [Acinetobacter sp. c3-l95]|uniref:outer membrane lipoprotein chaperone LolA n=1 Tax=Acinetobacter sp. c3-l95 TaxID=3342804 RepID=UPI0035BAA600
MQMMKSTFLALALSVPAIVSQTVMAAPASPQQATDNLVRQLNGIQNMTANFQQTSRLTSGRTARPNNNRTAQHLNQTFSGVMNVARPGKFYWETRAPAKQIIATTGRTVWIYDPDLQQAVKQTLDAQVANTPALLLSGNAQQIMRSYNISQPDASKTYYTLTPKSKDAAFERLWLSFGGNNTPTLMILEDATGQTTTIRFSNVRLNSNFNQNVFNFTPPKGTDIIEQ